MMSWGHFHRQSSESALIAQQLRSQGKTEAALSYYKAAADLDRKALSLISRDKQKTLGIIGVSASSLYYKAGDLGTAEQVAIDVISKLNDENPSRSEIQSLLQAVWNRRAKANSETEFLRGEILVSISGGEILHGGAPMEVVLDAANTVKNIVYRTVEYLLDAPLRVRGAASQVVKEICRPWLFQAPAGSYQFAISVEAPKQHELFEDGIYPGDVVEGMIRIIGAAGSGNDELLETLVDDEDYRIAFSKLTRNLLKSSSKFAKVRFYSFDTPFEANLASDSKRVITNYIQERSVPLAAVDKPEKIDGVLRALDLDRGWIEVDPQSGPKVRIVGLRNELDDVIGPMVNHRVRVLAVTGRRRREFRDIEMI